MRLHIVPILFTLFCIYWQGYSHGKYKFMKDNWYGGETLAPFFVWASMLAWYYAAYLFFIYVVGTK